MLEDERTDLTPYVDLVLRGGKVLALDSNDSRASALAVAGGRIVAIGDDHTIRPLIGNQTKIIELAGRTVLPGINDSHLHGAWLGASWPTLMLDKLPTAPPGVGDDLGGDPARTPPPTPRLLSVEEDRRAAIRRVGGLVAALGITSYTEPGIGPGEDDGPTGCFSQSVFETYAALEAEGELRARVNVLTLFGLVDGPSVLADVEAGLRLLQRRSRRPERLRIGGMKIFGDGIPPMLQAWTRQRYPDGSHGSLLVAGDDPDQQASNLRRMITAGHRAGLQVGVHATGDRTIEAVLDAVEQAMATDPSRRRHYIIHGDLVTPEQLRRMAALGVGLNLQPAIATRTADWVSGVLGSDVAASAWPIGLALEAGVALALSSDAPILTPDWRRVIAEADAWMGKPTPGAATGRMTTLLQAYTVAAAYQDGSESWKGTLEPGKVADLCVLAADPYEVGPAGLPAVDVELTVVGGKIIFERDPAYAD